MKEQGFFTGDKAIAFWTAVYMSVTGSYVRAPLDPPTQPSGPGSEALVEAAEPRAEVDTAA